MSVATLDFDELIKAGLLDKRALVNPVTSDGKTGYALVKGFTKMSRSNLIIALSLPTDDDGGQVLFMDNHVKDIKCTAEEYDAFFDAIMNTHDREIIKIFAPECSNGKEKE